MEALSPVHSAVQKLLPAEKRGKKRRRSYHVDEANGFTHAEMRAKVTRLRREKKSRKQIAETLGISVQKVRWYLEWADERGIKRTKGGDIHDIPPEIPRTLPTPGTVISSISASATPRAARMAFTAADPMLQRRAFDLRKHAVPFDEIAAILSDEYKTKLATDVVREASYNYLRHLNDQEAADTELERRMQLEQYDQMIRAITPAATGREADGTLRTDEVAYEAVDRMIKLLTAKSKLMGLDAPKKVDLSIRLQTLATALKYDYDELQELANEVITGYERSKALGSGS